MKIPPKLLLIETVVCFAPAVSILILGMMMVPTQIWFLVKHGGAVEADGPLMVFALVAAGVAGVIALANLFLWISGPRAHFLGRWSTLVGAVAGGSALLPYVCGPVDSSWWRLVGWMPLLCGAHLMYLGRAFLFARATGHGESA